MRRPMVLSVWLTIAVFGVFRATYTSNETKAPDHIRASPNLTNLYHYDNIHYFDGQLPQSVDVILEEIPSTDPDEHIVGNTEHQLNSHYYKISISPSWNPTEEEKEFTLYHEICHVQMWERTEARGEVYSLTQGHGTEWQNCMKNLAEENAFNGLW